MAAVTERTVQARIAELASKIGIEPPASLFDTFQEGHHAEIGPTLYWVARERGEERERRIASSLDELLYWIFKSITFGMAVKHATTHRIQNQDFRRTLFAKQLDLMLCLSPDWRDKCSEEINYILLSVPYRDGG
jgi:hypothetical protein